MSESRETPRRIVLTGFMASGKSTVGRELARLLGYSFADTDEMIFTRSGMNIPDIFEQKGEPHFRELELECCRELAGRRYIVIASGGGTVLDPERRELLCADSFVVNLQADSESLVSRIEMQGGRPLMFSGDIAERIEAMLAEREPVYSLADLQLDTSYIAAEDCALQLLPQFGNPSLITHDRQAPSPVHIIPGLLRNPERLHALLPETGRVFLLSDDNVMPLHGDALAESITETGRNVRWLTVPPGEASKSLAMLEAVQNFLAGNFANRDSILIGLGGGVITDLAGLAASLYMRGISLLQFPTSLMGMVDAAIGGKTAINFHNAKNLLGSFYLPSCVACDPQALATLPDRELRSGLAEVVKYDMLSEDTTGLEAVDYSPASRGEIRALTRLVERCSAQKCRIVSEDFREQGERKLLNFGHTIGHALESLAQGELLHGEAVGLGMLCACRIAVNRELAAPEMEQTVRSALEQCRLPLATALPELSAIMSLLQLDKKNRSGEIRMVLPLRPGQLLYDQAVEPAELELSLEAIRP